MDSLRNIGASLARLFWGEERREETPEEAEVGRWAINEDAVRTRAVTVTHLTTLPSPVASIVVRYLVLPIIRVANLEAVFATPYNPDTQENEGAVTRYNTPLSGDLVRYCRD